MNFPIYVISLVRAADRRANIRKRLDDAGVEYEIVDAVDGAATDPAVYEHRLRNDLCHKRYQERLTPNQIGCFLSHYNLWERMLAEQTPVALILEDDVCWRDGFFEVAAELPDTEWVWEVILMSHLKHGHVEKLLCDMSHDYRLVRYKRPGWNLAAYMVTLSGAKKLRKQCAVISGSVDTLVREYWHSGLALYDVAPPPAYQSGEQSVIGYDHRQPLTPTEKRQQQWARNYRGFRRKLHHLLHPPKWK